MVFGLRACAVRLDGGVALLVVPDRRRKVAFYEPTGIIEAPRRARRPHQAGIDGFADVGGARVSGTDLNAARAALDEGQGLPSPLFWTPVSLAILSRGRVNTWHLGRQPAARPSLLPSRCWPRPVFAAVVSALADAFLRDLADAEDALGGEAQGPA